MKHSIKKIFKNLNLYLFYIMFISFIFMMLTFEQQLSFDKITNLNTQQKIISQLALLETTDIELALIQSNALNAQLNSEINKLHDIYKYSFTEKYILTNEKQYLKALNKLNILKQSFTKDAHNYYTEFKHLNMQEQNKEILKKSLAALNHHIDSIILKDVQYNKKKFNLFKYLYIGSFLIVLLSTLWYRKSLYSIYNDLQFLISTDNFQKDYVTYTQEADSIALRMKRKNITTDDASMIDQVTGISNYNGLVTLYAKKRDMKDSYFTSVTILEIDNFSKSKRTYSQELTQNILKKIAFTISLYEKATDVIARTDYNQFTLILVRQSKEEAFKDADIIKQSISELVFQTPDRTNITTTGGFIIKPSISHLEDAIKQAKEVLSNAKKIGNNKVLQTISMANLK